jgi:pre-rRNA-processing protein TSR2
LNTGPSTEDLEDFLVEFLEGEYGVMLEDASEETVVRDLKTLWAECKQRGEGILPSLQEGFLERLERMAERLRREEGGRTLGTRVGGSDPGTSGESGDEEEERPRPDGDGMDVDQPQARRDTAPVVDDDGFELVQRSRRR